MLVVGEGWEGCASTVDEDDAEDVVAFGGGFVFVSFCGVRWEHDGGEWGTYSASKRVDRSVKESWHVLKKERCCAEKRLTP